MAEKQIEITTQGLQDHFIAMIETFMEGISKDKLFPEHSPSNTVLMLIVHKITQNLASSNSLWSQMAFQDARILLRSAFESLVLFKYLYGNKNAIDEYGVDSNIIAFKNHIGFFNRGYSNLQELTEHFLKLPKTAQDKLPVKSFIKDGKVLTFQLQNLEKYLIYEFKPLAQQTQPLLKKLVKSNVPLAKLLQQYSISIYSMNSQIAHGTLDAVFNYAKRPSKDKQIEEVLECHRQSIFIFMIIINTVCTSDIRSRFTEFWKKARAMYEYLGYDLSQYDKQPVQQSTSLIQIIRYPEQVPSELLNA